MRTLLWLLLVASLMLNIWLYGSITRQPHGTDTDTVTIVDTVMVRVPVVRDSVVVRTEIAYLVKYDTLTHDSLMHDTVPVVVPITQRTYSDDSTYTAWVSGYHASLDSISVYRQMELVAVREKPRRWTVGLSAGYGLTPKGLQPYVGIGVSYRLW